MMDPQKIDYFRNELKRQREQVQAEIATHRPRMDRISDLEEKADRAADNLVETRITEDDENLLRKIDFALERLDAGTYQDCDHCGKQIPLARLKAKPSASLCMSCQERKDAGRLSPS